SLAAVVSFTRADIAYQLVLVWALIAVAVDNAGTGTVHVITWIAVGVLGLILIGGTLLNRARKVRREGGIS
ncbi:MAG: tryptophan-rich sensory protein, partial [Anaerolineae bacterium]